MYTMLYLAVSISIPLSIALSLLHIFSHTHKHCCLQFTVFLMSNETVKLQRVNEQIADPSLMIAAESERTNGESKKEE